MVMGGSVIRGDAVVGGGNVILDAGVGRNVLVRGGTVALGKPVKGSVDIRAEEIVLGSSVDGAAVLAGREITLAPTAKFMRDVRFWSEKGDQQFAASRGQIRGKVTFDPTLRSLRGEKFEHAEKAGAVGFLTAIIGVGGFLLLSAALVILLMQLLTKTFFSDAAKFLTKKTWTSLLYGFLFFAATPVAVLLFLLSIIGIPIALLIGTMYIFAIVFNKPITALVLARTIELRRGAKWNGVKIFLLSVLLYLAMKIVSLIPTIGGIIIAATVFFAFGAVVRTKWVKWRKVR
jgi:carbonic anhydrase/acetyltransferase-like protein (isoleucine patch superfamily)